MKNINFASPETILILPIAIVLDGCMLLIGIVGDWWGFSDYGTIGFLGWIIIGIWAYFRRGGIREKLKQEERKEGELQEAAAAQEFAGSGNMEDWKENEEGVYQLNKKGSGQVESRGPKEPGEITKFAQRKNRQNKAMTDNPKNKQSITNVKTKAKQKLLKVAEKYGFGFIVKGVPIVGDFWPGFTIFVWRELGGA